MVIAAAGSNASEELMKFASDLTIDTEEYDQFKQEPKTAKKLPVNATTQDEAAQANFDSAADRNSFDMLAMFGMNMEKGKPG